ncbi:hypothetical protein PR202_gb25357 [Eleusine coracana subsp. coracana]|uniref:Uncharacterized protein n=1 Tax=Eleusine coracana subsp. coracana TaxID=191504 RepID=A0AAV5FLE2_ELECO|nr:hypothetical protein PR202_gb25312 [Eleusine coracana subsp. coracana]GJN36494.1 hypothetical protein PR202_gb25357 [Eleusine coracana subsp. coracana]
MGMETEEHGPATFLDTQLLTKTERTRQHDEQFARFVNIMKKLYINVPFVDAIQLMMAINDITLEKKPDPGSPSIKCMIGTRIFDRCLCDLGSRNLDVYVSNTPLPPTPQEKSPTQPSASKRSKAHIEDSDEEESLAERLARLLERGEEKDFRESLHYSTNHG